MKGANKMKLLHVSDLHLDSPFAGLGNESPQLQKELINAPFKAFERCVSIAINEDIDTMLISGDIYNSERQSIVAQHFFMKQMERLDKVNIPVVLIHGNHDYIRPDKARMVYPDNVHALDSRQVSSYEFNLADGRLVQIHGFSYTTKWIHERVINAYPINNNPDAFSIGLLHGALEGIESDSGNYAPFSIEELLSKNYDYWALGHIHKAEVMNQEPLIQYAGTIQGRHINETGDKGCYIVELEKGQKTKNTFYSLASIVWENAKLECESDWQANDIIEELQQIRANFQDEANANQQTYFIHVELTQAQRLDPLLLEQIQDGEFFQVLDQDYHESPFVLIHRMTPKLNVSLDVFHFDPGLEESFNKVVEELEEGDRFKTVVSDLYQHPLIKRHFNLEHDESLQEDMIYSARQLIAQMIGLDKETEDETHEN